MFNHQNQSKDRYMLTGYNRKLGYDWWWHSLTARNAKTGEEKPFFIEFFLCNPSLGGKYPILGQDPQNQLLGRKPSYLMVKAGTWGKDHVQLHRFFGWDDVLVKRGAHYHIEAEDCFASEKLLRGSIKVSHEDAMEHPEYMCDEGEMSFELVLDKEVAFNVGYGTRPILRRAEAFEMYWHAEGMKTKYAGNIYLNGEKYIVDPESSYGYADKNWGRGFTSPWIWLSSNHIVSRLDNRELKNTVFDIGGGQPKVYQFSIPSQLLTAMYYEGREFEFNFSKFWLGTRTRFAARETKDEVIWRVWQKSIQGEMKTEIHCKKEDMLLVNYEAPDGSKRHNRLWNGGNGRGRVQLFEYRNRKKVLVDDMDVYNVGCEYGKYDS